MSAYLTYLNEKREILSIFKFSEWDEACLFAQKCEIEDVKHVSVKTDVWPNHYIEAEKKDGYLDWHRSQ
jgi:hypothetical protein